MSHAEIERRLTKGVGSSGDMPTRSAAYFSVPGTLAISSDLTPRVSLFSDTTAVAVHAEVKDAPVGANLAVDLTVGANLWLTLTISDGSTSVDLTASDLEDAGVITAGENIRLDITATGTTFPGADLSVTIFA